VTELTSLIVRLQEENRQLRRDDRKRERALVRFEEQESDVPAILHREHQETHALREQLREQKHRAEKQEKALKQTSEELERTQK